MKNALRYIALAIAAALATAAHAQTKGVLKNITGNTITESLTFPTGKTLTISPGATINATGATITGFSGGGTWGSITGTLSAQTDLATALGLKAPLASPTFTGTVTIPSGASISGYATTAAVAAGYQPLNAALTLWNDTATTAFGRGLLAAADAAEFNLFLGLGAVDAVEFQSVTASTFTGNGSALTALDAGSITTGVVALANGGTGAALTDPGADRIGFWDDSAGVFTWLTAGSGLTITDTTLTASGGVATGDSPTWTGAHTFSRNGAVSAPTLSITGTVYTGGTATTTKPLVLIQPSGTTSTGWSTSGTLLGVNAATGFAGRLLDLQVNGATKFNVDASGNITALGNVNTSSYFFTSDAVYAGGAFGASQIYASSLGVTLGSSCYIAFTTGTAIAGTKDLYLSRSAATILGLHDGTNGASLELREQTAPSSPASNRARVYIEDNGSGKTRLMIKFPSGAAQQIAIEP